MLRYFHNFPAIGCFSNFTFTDTHTSSLNLNSPFPRYYKISQRKNSNRNLEVSSCNADSSPLCLYSPSSSCLAGFCVHLLPQPPVPPSPNSPGNPPRDPHFDWNPTPLWWARKGVTRSDDIWLSPMGLSVFSGSLWRKLCISLPAYWACWKKGSGREK